MIQQQNFSLEALAKRDAAADPFAKGGTAEPPPDEIEEEEEEIEEEEDEDEDDEDNDEEDNQRSMTLEDAEFFDTAFCTELELIQK